MHRDRALFTSTDTKVVKADGGMTVNDVPPLVDQYKCRKPAGYQHHNKVRCYYDELVCSGWCNLLVMDHEHIQVEMVHFVDVEVLIYNQVHMIELAPQMYVDMYHQDQVLMTILSMYLSNDDYQSIAWHWNRLLLQIHIVHQLVL
jgi:hypothetical protein